MLFFYFPALVPQKINRFAKLPAFRHVRLLWLPLGMMLACCGSAGSSAGRPPAAIVLPAAKTAQGPELRVATYNIYFRTRELAKTNAVLKKANADVVALQEVTAECAPLLDKECAGGYPYRHFSDGLGLLSRFPLRNVRSERSRRGINGFLSAEVVLPQGRIQIVNVHLDPLHLWSLRDLSMLPLQFRRQREIQREELAQACAHLKPGMPAIITGDFNRVGNAAVNRLRKLGFVDSLAAVTQKPDNVSTLHFSLLGLRLGRRIDYIFHDRSFHTLRSKAVSGEPSDHDVLVSSLVWQR